MRSWRDIHWVSLLSVLAVAMSCIPVAAIADTSGFEDVPPTHKFFTEINWLKATGITKGCNPPENSLFCPSLVVSRDQMAAFLARAFDLTEGTAGNRFIDDDGSIFEDDIEKIAYAGITLGCNPPDNTRYCPTQPVTRAEMAAFFTRALGLTDDGGYNWFTDDDGSIFENDIERIAYAGITLGCNPPDNTLFCPGEPVTRDQMAAFLYRALYEESDLVAAIDLTIELLTGDPIYAFDLVDLDYLVENTGSDTVVDVTVDTYPCEPAGPTVLSGNADDQLEPGEVWSFSCTDVPALEGYQEATAEALDSGGALVTADAWLNFSALQPVDLSVTPSASQVAAGETVVWTFQVSNLGEEAIWGVYAEGRMIEEGTIGPWPFFPLGAPTEIIGNGDEMLDHGEVWEWYDSKVMTVDAYYHADLVCGPWYQGSTGGWGYSAISDVVTVTGG